jgi:hypothetical protein
MDSEVFNSYTSYLNPEMLKRNLVQCSLFLTGFEVLKHSMVDRLRGYYSHEWHLDEVTGKMNEIASNRYKENVLLLHKKDEFQACCLWFQKSGALTGDDMERISEIRKHRNYIAHEITKVITSTGSRVNAVKEFNGGWAKAHTLVHRIDKYYQLNAANFQWVVARLWGRSVSCVLEWPFPLFCASSGAPRF